MISTTESEVVEFCGVGVHSGQQVSLRLQQMVEGGIRFIRTDLPGSPQIQATIENASGAKRRTQLLGQGCSIETPEHLLAALCGMRQYHVQIEIDGPEVPILDGSAESFVQGLQNWEEQVTEAASLKSPLHWSQGDQVMVALPCEEFRLSYTLDYPERITQHVQFDIDRQTFIDEIASCRTFCLYEEVAPLLEKGLIKGGSLDSAVVYKGNEVLASGGLRFSNESARHKLLDMIGDFSLAHPNFKAHIIAIKTGHEANVSFAKTLANFLDRG